MLRGKEISVIIPAYNEEKLLPGVLEKIPNFVDEVIVVDDGSSDGTYPLALSFSKKDSKVKAFRLERNCGKGCAMREGIKYASGDVVVFMDADGQHRPEDVIKLVEPVIDGKADVVIGARKGDLKSRPPHRRLTIITTKLI